MAKRRYVPSAALIQSLAQSPEFLYPMSFFPKCTSTGSSHVTAQQVHPADVFAFASLRQIRG